MSPTQRTTAIVLRRTNYGEADRIIQLLTPLGQRSVIAKGVRREKSKLAGGIELFAVSDVVIRRGRGELGVLTSARLNVFYHHILDDYERMQQVYAIMKLVANGSEQIDEPEWFMVLAQVLAAFNERTIDRRLIEAWFYLRYAGLLGSELNLHIDATGHKLQSDRRYMYDLSERVLRLSNRGNLTADHIKLLRLMQANSLEKMARIRGVTPVIADCWLVARQHAEVGY